mmetsp:Transcript_37034/g.102982  ORF Transcript_37034/g.102982 Transcript_37034/m.102982 type:complete len:307 (+) Transcript_37034:1074-1994(+)
MTVCTAQAPNFSRAAKCRRPRSFVVVHLSQKDERSHAALPVPRAQLSVASVALGLANRDGTRRAFKPRRVRPVLHAPVHWIDEIVNPTKRVPRVAAHIYARRGPDLLTHCCECTVVGRLSRLAVAHVVPRAPLEGQGSHATMKGEHKLEQVPPEELVHGSAGLRLHATCSLLQVRKIPVRVQAVFVPHVMRKAIGVSDGHDPGVARVHQPADLLIPSLILSAKETSQFGDHQRSKPLIPVQRTAEEDFRPPQAVGLIPQFNLARNPDNERPALLRTAIPPPCPRWQDLWEFFLRYPELNKVWIVQL